MANYRNDCGDHDKEISGQAFTKYSCWYCGKVQLNPSTAVPRLCIDCSDRLNACQKCMK